MKVRHPGVELVSLPDDLPPGCDDPEAFVAARRARAGGKLVLILNFVGTPGDAARR